MDANVAQNDDGAAGSSCSTSSDDDDFGTSDLIPLIDRDGKSGSRREHVRRLIHRHGNSHKDLMASCPRLTGCTVM